MDWWQPARDLLAHPDTPAGQALRWGLEGLRGCLTAALAQAPDDSTAGDARRVLEGLEEWLSPAKPRAAEPLAALRRVIARTRKDPS